MHDSESSGDRDRLPINPYSPSVPDSLWAAKSLENEDWEPKASIWEKLIGAISCVIALGCLALTAIFIVGVLADAAVGNRGPAWGPTLVLTLLMLAFGIVWMVAGVLWMRGRPALAAGLQGASMALLMPGVSILA